MLDVVTAQKRADALREESERDALGDDLFEGLAQQLDDPSIGLELQTQLLRIVGNACIDHEVNRDRAIQSNLPRKILKPVAASLSQPKGHDQLLFLRAAAGSLLNLVMDHTKAQEAFINARGPQIFLSAIDPNAPSCIHKLNAAEMQPNADVSDLQISAMTQLWFLRVLEELHQSKAHAAAFEALSTELMPLAAFVLSGQSYLSHPSTAPQDQNEDSDLDDLLETESNSLLVAASLFEALSMDIDGLAIAVSQSASTLLRLCDLVETQQAPRAWRSSDALRKNWNMVKSAASRGLIAAVSMDDVMVHCLDSEGPQAKSWIVDRCQAWLQQQQHSSGNRNDLTICSTVMLANLARNDQNCIVFVQDLQLVPVLFQLLGRCVEDSAECSMVKKSETTQILHGVLSLLKHLAVPPSNKPVIGAAGPWSACSLALGSSYDGAQPVQIAAVGLLKHLVTSSPPNAASFLTTGASIDSLLSLASRTDDVRLKSESTRVLVQLIRTLWMSSDDSHVDVRSKLARKDVLVALVEMVKVSAKWPILVNEGIVSLALVGSSPEVDYSPVIQDDAFLSTLAKGLNAPNGADPAETTTADSGASNGKKAPPALPDETRSNILSLIRVFLLAGGSDVKDTVDRQLKAAVEQVKQGSAASNPSLQERAEDVLSLLLPS